MAIAIASAIICIYVSSDTYPLVEVGKCKALPFLIIMLAIVSGVEPVVTINKIVSIDWTCTYTYIHLRICIVRNQSSKLKVTCTLLAKLLIL